MKDNAIITCKKNDHKVCCEGVWSVDGIEALYQDGCLQSVDIEGAIVIDASKIEYIDSAGALCLHQFISSLSGECTVKEVIAPRSTKKLLSLIAKTMHQQMIIPPKHWSISSLLCSLGKEVIAKKNQCIGFLSLTGELFSRLFKGFFKHSQLSFATISKVIETAGIQALPILGLLSFLVGVVLAYQMGLQLEDYGANIYIAFLTGMANMREFAPLITAIIVAGRSSSSFTAELGSMKINEEIDALNTMGLSAQELLILPKILGMFFVFPLLVFWAVIFSSLGSMITAKLMLHIPYSDYLHQLRESLGFRQLFLGLSKAPAFALIISLVGCFQGLQVKRSADSIGLLTTKAVVQAIFLIIIMDAIFSIIFSWLEL